MKEVVKISLAGVSFTIAKDAFEVLDAYIIELKEHYSSEQSCDEIVNDIEERISELILEKEGKEGIVSLDTINWIISTLGRPDDIDGKEKEPVKEKVQKKLFRDKENKVIGGVCSGIAAYTGLDVVWVRVIAVLIGFFGWMIGHITNQFFYYHSGSTWYVIIAYLLLWLIIPEAKTVKQKCAMRGESSGFDAISRKFNDGAGKVSRKSSGNNELNRVFSIVIGVILFLISVGGIISGFVFLFGFSIIAGFNFIDIVDYVVLNIGNTFILKALACLAYFLPFIGMLYASMKLIFNFKNPFWHPGLVIFLVWVVTCILLFVLGLRAFSPYFGYSDDVVSNDLPKSYDTMYVKYEPFGKEDMNRIVTSRTHYRTYVNGWRYSDDNNPYLYYGKSSSGRGLDFVYYPVFDLDNSDSTESYIECKMGNIVNNGFLGLSKYGSFNLQQLDNIYTVKDSLITLKPQTVSRANKFEGHLYEVELTVPEKTVVMVISPEGRTYEYRGH